MWSRRSKHDPPPEAGPGAAAPTPADEAPAPEAPAAGTDVFTAMAAAWSAPAPDAAATPAPAVQVLGPADAATPGPAGGTPTARAPRSRVSLPRRASAVALAVAAALAGGITTGGGEMLAGSSDDADAVDDTSELGGFLPVQEEELDMELAAFEDPELLEDVPVGEGEVSDEVEEVLESAEVVETLGESGIPEVAIEAYMDAADLQADADPQCGIRWTLLAAIGRVESNHGRFGGAQLKEDGYGTKPIRGIPLDGRPNVVLIRDTDGGELDGDTTFDRAVGPMQFIPSTWRSVGQDGNDDGRSDPNNMFDATQGAGAYLCAGDSDLDDTAARARAVRRYNNADEYVRVVLSLAMMYETGEVRPLPDLPATPPPAATPSAPRPTPPTPTPTPPPARPSDPGPRPAPTPTPPTTVPAPVTTTTTVPPTPSTTVPPPVDPEVPVDPEAPEEPETPETTTTVPPAPQDPPAAVGWAPAMREVVVDVLTGGDGCAGDEAPADVDADPDAEGTDAVNADESTLPEEQPCPEPTPAAGTAAAPADPPAPDAAAGGGGGG